MTFRNTASQAHQEIHGDYSLSPVYPPPKKSFQIFGLGAEI